MVTLQWMLTAQGQNEVGRNQPGTLVDQLEEAVLRVGAGLAPDHSAGGIVDRDAITGDPFAVALHVQLLQEGREMLEVLVVGDHRLGVGPAEIVVPDAEQRQDDRHIAFRRCLDEMLVHRVGAGQQLVKTIRPDRQRDRQADRGPQRITSTDPFPELEHVLRVDPEPNHRLAVGRHRNEVARYRRLLLQRRQTPGSGGIGVGRCLLRGEGLGGDHEQGRCRVQTVECLDQLGAVDIGHEMHPQIMALVGPQCIADHLRPETGTADADADHVADRSARMPEPAPLSYLVGKGTHAFEHSAHARHHVDAVDLVATVADVAQGHVQYRSALGIVDLVTAQQTVTPEPQVGGTHQCHQVLHRLVGDKVFRVVQVDSAFLETETLATPGVFLEQVSHPQTGSPVPQLFQ